MSEHHDDPPRSLTQSIDRIVGIEREASLRRSSGQAAVEAVVDFVGTLGFVVAHVAGLAVWIAINTSLLPFIPVFDPPPFNLLSTVVSFEGVILVALVLMTQRRMNDLADRRDHLDLQVNLMTERETTLILQMLHRISERMGIDVPEHDEARQLARPTSVDVVLGALHERIAEDETRS